MTVTLYSHPSLFGVTDNNGYGFKIVAFLRLVELPFVHEHLFDASAAPRGQLPFIARAHLTQKYGLTIDAALSERRRALSLLVTRLLDDLCWVMSYSRWKDGRYWPDFRAAFLREQSQPDRRRIGQSARIQFPAVLLSGSRPV